MPIRQDAAALLAQNNALLTQYAAEHPPNRAALPPAQRGFQLVQRGGSGYQGHFTAPQLAEERQPGEPAAPRDFQPQAAAVRGPPPQQQQLEGGQQIIWTNDVPRGAQLVPAAPEDLVEEGARNRIG